MNKKKDESINSPAKYKGNPQMCKYFSSFITECNKEVYIFNFQVILCDLFPVNK